MSKFLAALVITMAVFSTALAQPSQDPNEPPSKGVAPKTENGIGRADVRVDDENGNPIRNAFVKLESTRSDGFYCESWNDSDELGIALLPPIHMGRLKLIVKLKGYEKREFTILAADLDQPIRVVLHKKS